MSTFMTRTISGAVLVAILLGLILPGGLFTLCGFYIISGIGFIELSRALDGRLSEKKVNAYEFVGLIGSGAYYAALYFHKISQETFVIIIAVLLILMGIYVLTFPKNKCDSPVHAFFAFIYSPVLLSFIYLTRSLEGGAYIVWLIFIASWISDTGAYLVGRSIGKHKLAPVLSPKKSIEGSVGGILSAGLIGALYGFILMKTGAMNVNLQILIFAIIGAAGSVISQIGDLVASGVKRDRGVKDYGKLIPGHGGVMDRFDSVIVTAPIIFFLAYYLL